MQQELTPPTQDEIEALERLLQSVPRGPWEVVHPRIQTAWSRDLSDGTRLVMAPSPPWSACEVVCAVPPDQPSVAPLIATMRLLLPRLLMSLEQTSQALAAYKAECRPHSEVERLVRRAYRAGLQDGLAALKGDLQRTETRVVRELLNVSNNNE